jgi:hypothetical protein
MMSAFSGDKKTASQKVKRTKQNQDVGRAVPVKY